MFGFRVIIYLFLIIYACVYHGILTPNIFVLGTIFIDYTWKKLPFLFNQIQQNQIQKCSGFEHVSRYRSSSHINPTPSLFKLWHVYTTVSCVEDTSTVRHVQVWVGMVVEWYILIMVETVRRNGVYVERDTTEYGGFLLVAFSLLKSSWSDWT